MTKVAVVILNYNGASLLPQFLPSVIAHSGTADVIVADNASTDNSLQILADQFPSVKVITLDKNYGFCGGYNRAVANVGADYFVLLNSDVEVTPNWLLPLVNMFDQHPDVAAIQPKILSWREKTKFEYAGAGGGFIDSLGYPFCRGRIFDHVETDEGQYNDSREIFWATGACMMIRKKTYEQFDGLDEDLFAHMEEIDLCWKIHRAGMKVCYCGDSAVYHLGAGTLGYGNPRKTFLNFRNGLALVYKHLPPGQLIYKLPVRILLDWVASLSFIFKGSWANAISVFKAHAGFFSSLSTLRKKRHALIKRYGFYTGQAIYPGLIIFDYYLKRKKRVV